jgi:hypothetical protein
VRAGSSRGRRGNVPDLNGSARLGCSYFHIHLARSSGFGFILAMAEIETFIVNPGTPEIEVCARWRAEAFSTLEASVEQERRSLETFAADQTRQVALIAKRGTVPVGTCLLVPSEIEPNHQVSPWLAGLFVTPEHRRCGAASMCGSAGTSSSTPTGRVFGRRPSCHARSGRSRRLERLKRSLPPRSKKLLFRNVTRGI